MLCDAQALLVVQVKRSVIGNELTSCREIHQVLGSGLWPSVGCQSSFKPCFRVSEKLCECNLCSGSIREPLSLCSVCLLHHSKIVQAVL